jgi:hypothetical protein
VVSGLSKKAVGSILLAPLLLWSCVDVSGGAVEARWDIRDPAGVRIDCAQAQLAAMEFSLRSEADATDPCEADPRCSFPCDRGVGTTRFSIPVGQYAMSLHAVDSNGNIPGPAEGVVVPAPVVRSVISGQVTDLSVNLIIVDHQSHEP